MTGALLLTLIPLIPSAISQINGLINSFRALGLSDEEIMKHIAASEAKIDPLVTKVAAFQIQRHPRDTGA